MLKSMMHRWVVVAGVMFLAGWCWPGTARAGDNPPAAKEPAHAAAEAHPAAPAGEAHGAAGAHHGAETPQGPIEFKTDLALWSLVTFGIFVLVLQKFAWGPLMSALGQRETKVLHDLASAEQARARAEQLLAEHAARLDKVQDEIRQILAEARRDAEHTRQTMLASTEKEAAAIKQRALDEIERVRAQALDDLFTHMTVTVSKATEHVLGRSLTGADHDRLVQEGLAQFASKAG